MQNSKRLEREHNTLSKMIALFFQAHHHTRRGQLCAECLALADYAHNRIDRCPFGWQKPTCVKCPVHCYKPDRREEIRQIMRFAGPRMLLFHPVLAIWHLIDGLHTPAAVK